jgi:hypothetical protein
MSRYRSDLNTPRFGSEADVEKITGISRRTLQKNRLLGRGPKFYKFGRRVLYDLDEIVEYIRATASRDGAVEPAVNRAAIPVNLSRARNGKTKAAGRS